MNIGFAIILASAPGTSKAPELGTKIGDFTGPAGFAGQPSKYLVKDDPSFFSPDDLSDQERYALIRSLFGLPKSMDQKPELRAACFDGISRYTYRGFESDAGRTDPWVNRDFFFYKGRLVLSTAKIMSDRGLARRMYRPVREKLQRKYKLQSQSSRTIRYLEKSFVRGITKRTLRARVAHLEGDGAVAFVIKADSRTYMIEASKSFKAKLAKKCRRESLARTRARASKRQARERRGREVVLDGF